LESLDFSSCPCQEHNSLFGFPPSQKMSSENNDLQNVTIVRTIEEKNKESLVGRNCAEARSRATIGPEDAETYLANCEAALADAGTRDSLILERRIIAHLADDACLPEPVNERAAKLRSRISRRKGRDLTPCYRLQTHSL
jgi:hypothetical protein